MSNSYRDLVLSGRWKIPPYWRAEVRWIITPDNEILPDNSILYPALIKAYNEECPGNVYSPTKELAEEIVRRRKTYQPSPYSDKSKKL